MCMSEDNLGCWSSALSCLRQVLCVAHRCTHPGSWSRGASEILLILPSTDTTRCPLCLDSGDLNSGLNAGEASVFAH